MGKKFCFCHCTREISLNSGHQLRTANHSSCLYFLCRCVEIISISDENYTEGKASRSFWKCITGQRCEFSTASSGTVSKQLNLLRNQGRRNYVRANSSVEWHHPEETIKTTLTWRLKVGTRSLHNEIFSYFNCNFNFARINNEIAINCKIRNTIRQGHKEHT